MTRKTHDDAEQTKQKLLCSAFTLFRRNGYSGTTIATICKDAGVTKGAFYWHFPSKSELFMSLIDKLHEPLHKVFEDAMAKDLPPLEKLEGMLIAVLAAMETDDQIYKIFEMLFLKVEHTEDTQPIFERERTEIDEFLGRVQEVVLQGQESGQIRPDIDSQIAARSMLALIAGTTRHWIVYKDQISLKERAAEFVEITISGLRV